MVTRIPLAAGTMGVGYVVMALATSLPVGALGLLHRRHGQRLLLRLGRTQAIQERTADEFQGRVMGLLESTTAGGFGIGFLLAAALTELISVRVTFAATAVGVILATILMATLLRGATPGRHAAAELAQVNGGGDLDARRPHHCQVMRRITSVDPEPTIGSATPAPSPRRSPRR